MLRLITATLLLLSALLNVFMAPTWFFWYYQILVAGLPVLFMAISMALLLSRYDGSAVTIAGSIISLIALILFALPIVRGLQIAKKLPGELDAAFPPAATKVSLTPLSAPKLVTGQKVKKVAYKTYTYFNDSNAVLTLDYYSAATAGKRPCVVVIHGGSWANGDSQQLPDLNSTLAGAGYQVASINYRHAPKYKSPLQLEDIGNALIFLKSKAGSLQIDTSRLVLLGRSAGGQLALMAAYTFNDADIKGVIGYYAPSDLEWGYQNPANPLVHHSKEILENFLGDKYQRLPQPYHDESPVNFVSAAAPPTLLIHGQNDALVAYEHSVRLDAQLTRNRVPHYVLTLPWATHGFDYFLSSPGGQLSEYAVLRFLGAVCKK